MHVYREFVVILMSGILCLTFTNIKKLYLIEMFNDTLRYLDDILTIDYPELNKRYLLHKSGRNAAKQSKCM